MLAKLVLPHIDYHFFAVRIHYLHQCFHACQYLLFFDYHLFSVSYAVIFCSYI